MEKQRQDWDDYFMTIARTVATRSTCSRKNVGAVIERNRVILSTGYNGSIRGMPHCDDAGHMMKNTHCIRTVHAEANALVQAARMGTRVEDATIFVTALPCFDCFKLIANSGIISIVFDEFYRGDEWPEIVQTCRTLGISIRQLGTLSIPNFE